MYGLYLMQRSFQGEPNPQVAAMPGFGLREMSVMAPIWQAWCGWRVPQPVLDLSAATIRGLGVLPRPLAGGGGMAVVVLGCIPRRWWICCEICRYDATTGPLRHGFASAECCL